MQVEDSICIKGFWFGILDRFGAWLDYRTKEFREVVHLDGLFHFIYFVIILSSSRLDENDVMIHGYSSTGLR